MDCNAAERHDRDKNFSTGPYKRKCKDRVEFYICRSKGLRAYLSKSTGEQLDI